MGATATLSPEPLDEYLGWANKWANIWALVQGKIQSYKMGMYVLLVGKERATHEYRDYPRDGSMVVSLRLRQTPRYRTLHNKCNIHYWVVSCIQRLWGVVGGVNLLIRTRTILPMVIF